MKKLRGDLVYSDRDEFGCIEVYDLYDVRYLHFGTEARQSALCIQEPSRLEFRYLRAMMASLLFNPAGDRFLLLGLGGGGLARFLLEHFPLCQIEVIELRPKVVDVAYRYFQLPRDQRIKIHLGDCFELLEEWLTVPRPVFDHVFVDVFDGEGACPLVTQPQSLSLLSGLVCPKGVVSFNLWSSPVADYQNSVRALKSVFGLNAWFLPVLGRENVIIFGQNQLFASNITGKSLRRLAYVLQSKLGIEYTRFLTEIRPIT